jgi:hypothetical protein
MHLRDMAANVIKNLPTFRDALMVKNPRVLLALLGPAVRGLVLRNAEKSDHLRVRASHHAHFDWKYDDSRADIAKLYAAAKKGQWTADGALDWSVEVDPYDPNRQLLPHSMVPSSTLPLWSRLSAREKAEHTYSLMSWLLSQFLHGEQGALLVAAQVTEAVPDTGSKFFGAAQVMDEARHVEVFHRYLADKLQKEYQINDNLYVLLDAVMQDSRWDLKFLGMQIMIEGLALGAFGTMRQLTGENLLKDLLRYVITDEARHVHYGVVSLRRVYLDELSEKERQEREDWAFEMALLLHNRFLLREFYEEFYGHVMSLRAWEKFVDQSDLLALFRETMFKRIVPNLKHLNLLSDRVRPHYAKLGILRFEDERPAHELDASELVETTGAPAA